MPAIVVVGAQWGDEGKGKVVDILTEFADVVVRFQGGDNAGHTVIVGDEKIVLHLIPSGVLRRDTRCVLAQGMVVRPEAVVAEIDALARRGYPIDPARLAISARAHVVLPLHLAADEAEEKRRGARGIGTTRRGIGPCYEDKSARRGVRFGDLGDPARLRELVLDATAYRRPLLEAQDVPVPDPARTCDDLRAAWERLGPHVADTGRLVAEEVRRGRHVLFEGAQGTLLDIDHGTYPFVTSSTTTAAGACAGSGVAPSAIDGVLGVCKAYTTRVGNGPFPTEADPPLAEKIRQAGAEFGATTGRPRRCGWFDAAAVRYAVRVNGITSLALTKLDVLSVLGPEIKVCTGYEVDGAVEPEIPLDRLDRARPVYETVKGVPDDLRDVRSPDDLPPAAGRYLSALEKFVGVPVALLSVGPRRAETLVFDNPFRTRKH
ncbi:MAG: adenylosuccinate synthase [Deltaproteobacteria bacterium]|nr:adenylosuccinate synthase [Deltaproteobacteria bacterium]